MAEEAAFLAAIRAAPEDETALLVYADWLEERDDPRAEYVRLAVLVRRHLRNDPGAVLPILGRYVELECTLPVEWVYRVNGSAFDVSNLYHTYPFFWRITDATVGSLRALRRLLEALPIERLPSYHEEFRCAVAEVDPAHREEYFPHLTAGCSEDHGDDFGAWVVMQGREFHRQVATEHARIGGFLPMYDDALQETRRLAARLRTRKGKRRGPTSGDDEADQLAYRNARGDYLAREVYESRFGREPTW
jgi:uncharacterized protein (TIGR02996 family)